MRHLLALLVLLLATPAFADGPQTIPLQVRVEVRDDLRVPVLSWTAPDEVELDTRAIEWRIEQRDPPDGSWLPIGRTPEASRTFEAPAADRVQLEARLFRIEAWDTGSPVVKPRRWGSSPEAGSSANPAAGLQSDAEPGGGSVVPAAATEATTAPTAPTSGAARAENPAAKAPKDSDGLFLVLEWTASTTPAAWAVLRRPAGSEGDWTVSTSTLPGGTETYSDKVTEDPQVEPPLDAYEYKLVALDALLPEGSDAAAILAAGTASETFVGQPVATILRLSLGPIVLLLLIIAVGVLMYVFTEMARRGKEIYIRRIPGIDAIEEGIGRATEMGKPVLYVPGIDELQDIQTIASVLILGQVSKKVAEYQSELIVSCCIPIVREVADEVVRAGFFQAGHPDAYRPENTRFISSEQFAFCAGTNGIIYREKPATNIYLGRFFAESLILAETGFVNKSIQIAGTAEATQLPFFIAACDYTLIGEELFAVSAYLSGDPRLVSSLKASDWIKVFLVAAILLGTFANSVGSDFFVQLFTISAG